MNTVLLAYFFSLSIAYLWLLETEKQKTAIGYQALQFFLQSAIPFAYWILFFPVKMWIVPFVLIVLLTFFKISSRWVCLPPPLFAFLTFLAGAFFAAIILRKITASNTSVQHFQMFLNNVEKWWHLPAGTITHTLFHLTALMWIVWGGTAFVRSILHPFASTQKTIPGEEWQRGKVIGNLERLLIYFLVQLNLPAMVTLIVGLKAVARFKQLEEREFAEYFLIGTLSSLLFALGIAFGAYYLAKALG